MKAEVCIPFNGKVEKKTFAVGDIAEFSAERYAFLCSQGYVKPAPKKVKNDD